MTISHEGPEEKLSVLYLIDLSCLEMGSGKHGAPVMEGFLKGSGVADWGHC